MTNSLAKTTMTKQEIIRRIDSKISSLIAENTDTPLNKRNAHALLLKLRKFIHDLN